MAWCSSTECSTGEKKNINIIIVYTEGFIVPPMSSCTHSEKTVLLNKSEQMLQSEWVGGGQVDVKWMLPALIAFTNSCVHFVCRKDKY